MKIIKRNTITTAFSILPRHMEMIQHFIEDKGTFTSSSDVVRKALEFFHDKSYPAYIFHLTPGQAKKQEELNNIKSFESMSNEEYATSILKALVRSTSDNIPCAILYNTISNESYFVIPLETIKEWAKEKASWVNDHLAKVATDPMDGSFVSSHAGKIVEWKGNTVVI